MWARNTACAPGQATDRAEMSRSDQRGKMSGAALATEHGGSEADTLTETCCKK